MCFRILRDPRPILQDAIADLQHAIRLNGRDDQARMFLGDAYGHRGLAELELGQPAEASFAAAEEAFAEAVRMDNKGTWLHLGRGIIRIGRGRARAATGGDPLADWAGAEADLTQAARLFPAYADPAAALGRLQMERGAYRRRRGDPGWRADLLAAARDLDRALAIDLALAEARAAMDAGRTSRPSSTAVRQSPPRESHQ